MTEVANLITEVTAFDGLSPVNESAELVLAGRRAGEVLLEPAEEPTGFAIIDRREQTIMLAVAPTHRRQGHGSKLLALALSRAPEFQVWAFGTLTAAKALAARVGLVPIRQLLNLGRRLDPELAPKSVAGVTIRGFAPADADAIVAINREAFSHHPEQGKLTRAEFDDLTRQPWFDPAGLLVAETEGQVVGFHWTKRHDEHTGEVYVIAVSPAFDGRGIGRALLESGLLHLSQLGCRDVMLFVEASETRVVEMYRTAGFNIERTDTGYRASGHDDQ